jgi:hypothetical protein
MMRSLFNLLAIHIEQTRYQRGCSTESRANECPPANRFNE